jgi:hypothetical protein
MQRKKNEMDAECTMETDQVFKKGKKAGTEKVTLVIFFTDVFLTNPVMLE